MNVKVSLLSLPATVNEVFEFDWRDGSAQVVSSLGPADAVVDEKWARGKLSRNAMMGWAVEHWHWVSKMNAPPFSICSKAPPDVIAMEMGNYHEENDDEKPHLEIVLRFAKANGADVEKVKAGRGLPTTRSWANWLVQVAKEDLFREGERPVETAADDRKSLVHLAVDALHHLGRSFDGLSARILSGLACGG